ncbi:MAG: hypothetical protein AMXMBFR82_10310 [Candidatus Hydrogenedentota bacterium]
MLHLLIASIVCAAAEFQTFDAPGYDVPVSGVWFENGEAQSALPLGALGTGYIDLRSDGRFGESTVENNYLRPAPVGSQSGWYVQAGEKRAEFLAESAPIDGVRFWGHVPAADVTLEDVLDPVEVSLRAYAPLVPHDYSLSELPVAFFRYRVNNTGSEPIPVELGLQWDLNPPRANKAEGNVEAALAWRRESLAPGETWHVTPVLAFATEANDLPDSVSGEPQSLEGESVPQGLAFAFDDVTSFYLDPYGGFVWDAHKEESAVFAGAPTIGQLLWQIEYDEQKAGRGPNVPFSIAPRDGVLITADDRIAVTVTVRRAGHNTIALDYAITNRTDEAIPDLRFAFAANVDIGGPGKEGDDRAAWVANGKRVVVESAGASVAVALMGEPDEYIVSTWPNAHIAMDRRQLVAVDGSGAPPEIVRYGADVFTVRGGSYALGASGNGWQFENKFGEVLRATAARTLQPGEIAEVTFALAWYFPTWESSDGEALRHRYAKRFDSAYEVLEYALPQHAMVDHHVVQWQSQVYASDASPALNDAVINSLYILPRNSWWLDDGRFFQSESFTGCPITETLVCRFNGSFPLALLFPECEKATMREFAKWQGENGQIAFGFGTPAGTQTPMMHLQIPIVSSEYVLLAWRNYQLWQNEAYLDNAYSSVKDALRFCMTLDTDGDGLINEAPGSETGFPANQYYDIWPWWGTSAYTASIWLGALKAGIAMAERQDDAAFTAELQDWFDRGVAAYNDKLWTGEYYRLYSGTGDRPASDTSLTNALCGQWFAYASGLGELVPHERIDSVIDSVLRLNAQATPYGAVNGVKPDGSVDTSFHDHSAVITIGEVWNFCAMAAFAGRAEDAMDLFDRSYANVALNHKTPWNIPWSLDRDTGAIKWGINYYSNSCVWTLFQAMEPEVYARLGKSE